jgi:hypothetical protein
MGLDFSHCDAHWSYSGFNEFRVKLAEAAGIVLGDMEGFHHFKLEEAFKDGAHRYREKVQELLDKEIAERGPKKSWATITDPIKRFATSFGLRGASDSRTMPHNRSPPQRIGSQLVGNNDSGYARHSRTD